MKKLAFVIAASALCAGVAFAQTPTAQPSTASTVEKQPSTISKVENWTSEQWNAAKAEWAKDTAKWARCQQQSSDQNLSGQKSWSFLYTCMNT
jgi:hypothetical protein